MSMDDPNISNYNLGFCGNIYNGNILGGTYGDRTTNNALW